MLRRGRAVRVFRWVGLGVSAAIIVAWFISIDRLIYAESGRTQLAVCDGNLLWFELYESVPWKYGFEAQGYAQFWIDGLELRHGLNWGCGYAPWIGIELRRGIPLWQFLAFSGSATLVLSLIGRRRRIAGRCSNCGYDLTGNESGVCSECGEEIVGKAEVEKVELKSEAR